MWNIYLYCAIENTANQNAGKPLYIRQYSTFNLLSTVFSVSWYIVMQPFFMVYHGILYSSLVFSWYTHSANLRLMCMPRKYK